MFKHDLLWTYADVKLQYIPGSNLFSVVIIHNLWGNHQKIQGLHVGTFLRLENRYICGVSDACIQQIHYRLSATFSDKYRWLNFTRSLGWRSSMDKTIKKASLVLYIARTLRAMPWPTWHLKAVRHSWVHLLWLKFVTVKDESVSDSIWGASIDVGCRLYMHYNDDQYWLCVHQLQKVGGSDLTLRHKRPPLYVWHSSIRSYNQVISVSATSYRHEC